MKGECQSLVLSRQMAKKASTISIFNISAMLPVFGMGHRKKKTVAMYHEKNLLSTFLLFLGPPRLKQRPGGFTPKNQSLQGRAAFLFPGSAAL